jgi:ribonucleotide reductase beta subunit family protein with ferritin-like domain
MIHYNLIVMKTMESYLTQTKTTPQEPILCENGDRFTAFPIKYEELYNFYKKQVAAFWTPEEVDLSRDMKDWKAITQEERDFIKLILAFFASSDGIVMENLAQKFMGDVKIFEAQANYAWQINIETIHSIMYSLLIEAYISDEKEKAGLFSAVKTYPCVKKKADWAFKWLGSSSKFAERLVAFSAVEGIFFSASFCAIYWFKQEGLLPGLCQSNELIARDEGFHTTFAVMLHDELQPENRCSPEVIKEIILDAVSIEKEFVNDILPTKLTGMNAESMCKYVEVVADNLLSSYGIEPVFKSENPFPWMELISIEGKTSFFEKRVTEYQVAGVLGDKEENKYKILDEF